MPNEDAIPVVLAQDPKSIAARTLEAVFAKKDAEVEVKSLAASKEVWGYGCDVNAGHFGIFFVGDPHGRQEFGPGDWYSVYHDNAQAHDFEFEDIICQQCYAETGRRTPLRVSPTPSARGKGQFFRVAETWMQRFAHKVPRADLAKWEILKKGEVPPAPAPEPVKPPNAKVPDARPHASASK